MGLMMMDKAQQEQIREQQIRHTLMRWQLNKPQGEVVVEEALVGMKVITVE